MKNKVIAVISAVVMILSCNISSLTVYADNSIQNNNMNTVSKNETKYNIKDILADLDYISEATGEELEQICGYYKLDKDMLELSGKQGYTLQKALDITTLAKQLMINKEEFQKLLEIYRNSDNDNREIFLALKMLEKEKLDSSQTAKVKEQILANNSIDTIIAANKISKALNVDANRLLKKDKKLNRDIVSSNAELKEKEKKVLGELGKRYNIDLDTIVSLAKERNKSIEEIGLQVSDYELKNGISDTNTIMALSTSVSMTTASEPDGEKYKEYYNAPFYYRSNTEEYISPGSGSLRIQNTDLSIPGRNGMDLNLTTSYDSAKAGMYRPIPKYNGYGDYDTTINLNTYEDCRYNIGTGWSFNISFLRQVTYPNELFDSHVELHLGTGEVYFADKESDEVTYSFDEYEPCDMVLKLDSSYSYTAPGDSAVDTESYYVLQYKDGKKEYFDYYGFLLCIMDRYGNTIRFEYTDPFINDMPLVARIIDTVKRTTNIWYDETDELGNRYIRIQRPDYNSIVYKLAKSTIDVGEYVIVQRTDPKYYETYYEYEYKTGEVTFDDDKTPHINKFANMTKVTYPTGALSNYTYEMATGMLGSFGYKQYYRIKTRNDEIDEVVSGVVTNRNYYDQKTCNYEGEQSGWPNYDPDSLPDTFTYKSTIVDANNNQVIHTFNNKHLDVKEVIKENGTTIVEEISKEYYLDKYPAKETTRLYNSAGQYREYFTNRIYNDYGDLLEYTDKLGHKTSYQYESKFHQLDYETKEFDAGVTQNTDYYVNSTSGSTDRIVQNYKENGVNKSITTDFAYDSYGNLTSSKVLKNDGTYSTANYAYDPTYNYAYLTQKSTVVKDFNGNSQTVKEEYTYDDDTGERLTAKDGNDHITTYDYDSIGRLKKVVNPSVTKRDGTIENSSISMSYSVNYNYIIVTLENGFKTKYQYDALGRLLEKQDYKSDIGSYAAYERTHYNNIGQVDSTTTIRDSSNLYTTSYSYDVFGRIKTTTNPDQSLVQVLYDDVVNKSKTIDEEGNQHEMYYDNAGNLVKGIAYPDKNNLSKQNITQYQYNYIGKLKKVVDTNNHETNYQYDEIGRLTTVTNGKQEPTKYKYDNLNNLIEITNAKNEMTKRQYDDLSRLITVEYPVNRKEYFKYDSVGNLLYSKDRKGQEFNYNYDERDRLKEEKLGAATILSYDYDKISNLLWAENNTGKTSYEYYGNGDLKQVTEADGKYIYYEYDNIGNRTKMKDHFGQELVYGYDNRSRLNTVSIGSAPIAAYDYYLNNILKCVNYANGAKEEYSEYDGAKNLKTLVNKKADGSTLNSYGYTYDGAGNQETKNENNIITSFDYDTLNRIQTVTQSGAVTQAFTYDSAGNIDNMYSENFSVGITADYTFNELNQLTQYAESERLPFSYTYYANGLRKTKTVDGITTTYYYDGDNAIIEAENGSLSYRNIYGMNQIGREDAAGNLYYFLYNGHGDVVNLVDGAGNIKNSYEYDIYGKVTNISENGIPNPMRYAGQMYDSESGLYYLRARYYDPRIGRFINEDTNKGDINNPSSLNLYTYCWGNPILYIDYNGHDATIAQELISYGKAIVATGAMVYSGVKMLAPAGVFVYEMHPISAGDDEEEWLAQNPEYLNKIGGGAPEPPNKCGQRLAEISVSAGAVNQYVQRFGIKAYHKFGESLQSANNALRHAGEAVLQQHHIIEQRFRGVIGNVVDQYCIAISADLHQKFTNAWSAAIPRSTQTTSSEIFSTAIEIYKDFPEIVKILEKLASGQ